MNLSKPVILTRKQSEKIMKKSDLKHVRWQIKLNIEPLLIGLLLLNFLQNYISTIRADDIKEA